ncbi:hypothetical protein C8R45DRAFT_89022 [Mycena sanguinolenta]|nr:hypothetical protein C8R45DRAFT_89022 [Mycena sanguinolenta]
MEPPAASIIQLSPLSAAFVNERTTSLGTWVLGGFLDCILLGVVFCQARTYFRTRPQSQNTLQRLFTWLVIVLVGLSILKTAQNIAIVWVQNVLDFANPDVARLLVEKAWWQVSTPMTTAVIGSMVQSFFCLRFYMLSRSWILCVPIACAMCLGLGGACLSVVNILAGNVKGKVMWLLVHLVGVFSADLCITSGTVYYMLQKRNGGLERTTKLINRLVRLVFESAVPPTLIAMTDLIMTQTLGQKLLWHLLMNDALSKVYVVSLLYTLNSINEYRVQKQGSQEIYSYGNGRNSRRTNMELTPRSPSVRTDQIFVQTEVSKHISPLSATSTSAQDKGQYNINSDFKGHEDDASSDKVRYV